MMKKYDENNEKLKSQFNKLANIKVSIGIG